MIHYFTTSYIRDYLLRKPDPGERGHCGWATRIWCRLRNHPCGPVWYNPGGLAPDPHCKVCGDYLM